MLIWLKFTYITQRLISIYFSVRQDQTLARLNICVTITPMSWTSPDPHGPTSDQQPLPIRWAVIKHHTAILLDACGVPETIVTAISIIWSLKQALNKHWLKKWKKHLVIQVPGSNGYGRPLFRRRCPHLPPREVPMPTSAGYRSRDGGAKTYATESGILPIFPILHPSLLTPIPNHLSQSEIQ